MMERLSRKWDYILLVGGLLIVLAALGAFLLHSPGLLRLAKPITLRLAYRSAHPEMRAALEAIAAAFEAENPGISVQLEDWGSDSDDEERILAALGAPSSSGVAAQPLPPLSKSPALADILAMDLSRLRRFQDAGLLSPLDTPEGFSEESAPFPEANVPPGDEAPPDFAGRTDFAGSREPVYAWPLFSFMDLLFYRSDLLVEAGIIRPPRDSQEFLDCCRTLTGEGRWGLGMALAGRNAADAIRGAAGDLLPWFRANASSSASAGLEGFFESREAEQRTLETLGFLNTLFREALVSPDIFSMTAEQNIQNFILGRSPMMIASTALIASLSQSGVPFGIAPVPASPARLGRMGTSLQSWAAALCAQSAHPEEAAAFLARLWEEKDSLASALRAVPGSRDSRGFYSRPWYRRGGDQEGLELYVRGMDIFEASDPIEELPLFSAGGSAPLEFVLRRTVEALFAGTLSPRQASDALRPRSGPTSGF